MTLASPGITGKDHPLLAAGKGKSGEIHDLSFIDASLEVEIEVGKTPIDVTVEPDSLVVAPPGNKDCSIDVGSAIDGKAVGRLIDGN